MADTSQTSTEEPIKPQEVDSKTRLQARKELHEKKQKERLEKAQELKTHYASVKENPAFVDILEKARQFKAWHNKLAVDGVGAKNLGVDDSGAPIIEDFYLSDSQVARELGGAAALEQLIVYIENKLS
jgi:hypothetical protein